MMTTCPLRDAGRGRGLGTLIAALVTTQLPAGTWSDDLLASFFRCEPIIHALLAVVVERAHRQIRCAGVRHSGVRQ